MRIAVVLLVLFAGVARADRCVTIKKATPLYALGGALRVGETTASVTMRLVERKGSWDHVRVIDYDVVFALDTYVAHERTRRARCPEPNLHQMLEELPVTIDAVWEDGSAAYESEAGELATAADQAPHHAIGGVDHACFTYQPVDGVRVHVCAPCDALRKADQGSLVQHAICR